MGLYRDTILEKDRDFVSSTKKYLRRPSQVALLIGYASTEAQDTLANTTERERDSWYINEIVKAFLTIDSRFKVIKPKVACGLTFETSALRQILVVPFTNNMDNKVTKLNQLLPHNIVCYGARNVTSEFHPKYSRKILDKRDYKVFRYILPSYALNPNFPYNSTRNDRVSDETLQKLNRVLEKFEGLRVYRNYENNFKNTNSSFVISAHTGHPWIMDELEFIDLIFEGKGIVPLQVLCIVGVVISNMRGLVDDDDLSNALKRPLMDLPMAPPKGLVLQDVQFGSYNEDLPKGRYRKENGEFYDKLDWASENEQINNFELKIVKEVIRVVKYEGVFEKWLRILPYINYI